MSHTTTPSTPASPEPRGTRGRKVRALLAAGVVLGVGATATLAAWNDSEFVDGDFAAGSFNLEGSSDGTSYTDHAEAGDAAALAFELNPTNLSPGDVVHAPYAVRLAAGTTTGATVALTGVTNTGTVTNLTYTVVQTTSMTCNAEAVAGGTMLVPAGTAMSSVGTPDTFTLAQGTADATAGDPAYLCFAVTAGEGLEQGQNGTATWQFQATSTS